MRQILLKKTVVISFIFVLVCVLFLPQPVRSAPLLDEENLAYGCFPWPGDTYQGTATDNFNFFVLKNPDPSTNTQLWWYYKFYII